MISNSSSTPTIPLSKTTKFIVDNRGRTAPTVASGIALIATNCISNDDFYPTYEAIRYVDEHTYANWFRAHPQPGDIILTLKGSQNGAVCLVPDPVDFVIAQDMVALRADEEVIDPLFLLAALRSPHVQWQIKNLDVSGVIPHFKKTDFDKLHLPYPARPLQSFIGQLYFNLSAKIELNRRRNRTLEAMARAIFQSWFVDFDPVKAKADGGTPPGLSPALAALFPDRFEDSALGPIPVGWRVGKVRELCVKVENGGTPKRHVEEYWTPEEVPWLTSGEVRQPFVVGTESFISKSGFDSSSAKMWPPFTTVVALYGATAGFATMLGIELCANQACCGLVPKAHAACFIHQLLSGSLVSLQQQTRGSAQQNLSQSIVADFQCLIPTPELLQAFEKRVRFMYLRCIEGIQESRTLAELRDSLLPKVISGELRVPDAERVVERNI